jgi:soluble lytic murein transglycosylase-like protein
VGNGGRRRRARRRRGRLTRAAWGRLALEIASLLTAALVLVIAVVGRAADAVAGAGLWSSLLPFAAMVLVVGAIAALGLRSWLALRPWLAARARWLPAATAGTLGALALVGAGRPSFQDDVAGLRALVGGPAETQRRALAHQVYAAYRRADLGALTRMLDRARVYEPTVLEAASVFGVDPEVLMGVGAAESSFNPRDSPDGGRGLFQITAPPQSAVADARRHLGVASLDALNQRHNAFVAAATLRLYMDQMAGDLFLGLLAYNIGPRNGGLRAIMEQYGARDFVTIQPYLQNLPRDYPIRVLQAALAYRLWRAEGRLPPYEEGGNARHIQRLGIPGLDGPPPPATAALAAR